LIIEIKTKVKERLLDNCTKIKLKWWMQGISLKPSSCTWRKIWATSSLLLYYCLL